MKIFGPVPSRRLGKSLGINIIPYKNCSYDCVYCQVGKTDKQITEKKEFYSPEEIFEEVKKKLEELDRTGGNVDFLTLVSQGEPLLDINLEREINLLKKFGIKIALITNASLITDKYTREVLYDLDWISLKIDTVKEDIWKKINRPDGELDLEKILEGIVNFSKTYSKILTTETMIIKELNDRENDISPLADFLAKLNPYKSYISIPIRPPAEKWVKKPDEEVIISYYNLLKEKINSVEYLTGYEGNDFVSSGKAEEDILAITSVHPMKEDGIKKILSLKNLTWDIIEKLLETNLLVKTEYRGENFYTRGYRT